MMNNIILNGVNSNTIQGLIIQELPPISKPAIRTEIEEIDGRDGDVITKLGYAAYDKQLSIGLYGNYDINQVISFFNTSGTVTFSNEPDKYYNYQILNEIDFERLVRFRTAIVTMHVQPFKYSATETPQELSGTVITGEGSNISLVNTTDSGLFTDLQKKGDTFQQTYSGKNLFNVTDYTNLTLTNNGYATNTKTSDEITITTGSGSSNSGVYISTTYLQQYIDRYDNTTDYYVSFDVIASQSLTLRIGATTKDTRNIGTTKTRVSIQTKLASALAIYSTNNRAGDTINVSNIMVSTNNDITYEPYVGGVPSPNPSYPQEIKTVTGNNNITICGKNLFNGYYVIANGHNGIQATYNQDGSFSYSGTATSNYANLTNTTSCNYSAGTYTFSINKELTYRIYLTLILADGTSDTTIIIAPEDTSKTFTTQYNILGYRLSVSLLTSGTFYDETLNIQLEKSQVPTDYEAYQSQTYPINLGNIELCSINGTEDYIYKNNGTWYLHKATGKVVLNGSENWTINKDKTYVYQFYFNHFANDLNLSNSQIISNNFKYQTGDPTDTTNEDYTWVYNKALLIDIRKSITSSLANFKTWLSTHNTEVYYLLETPTDTEITDSTLLSQLNALGNATTYLGTTNISTSGDELAPILYVETVAVDDPVLKITNSGNTTAKPIMTLYGTGTINLSLNGEQIFVIDLSSENYIIIDVANMEAYYNGILKNRLVTGNYENFVLNQGENEITFTGTLYSLTISNYSRWI